MTTLQGMFEDFLEEFISHEGKRFSPNELTSIVTDSIPEVAKTLSESILKTIKRDYKTRSKETWLERRAFEERLWDHWKEPLSLLDLFISLAREAGDDCNRELRENATFANSNLLDALTALHARACQIASAVLILLRSGFADDAHARWRSLHEISVVGNFIAEHGEKLAERYLLHDTIQRYKLASALHEYADRVNEEPLTDAEFEDLKSSRDDLVQHFGKPFVEDYGWAADILNNQRPTMKNIERSVQLEHWAPYFRMASGNVHANAHGTYFRLGLNQEPGEVLLAGPSNTGFAEPADSTAISLFQITVALLTIEPNLDRLVYCSILQRLADEVGESFIEVQNKLESLDNAEESP